MEELDNDGTEEANDDAKEADNDEDSQDEATVC